MQRYKDAAGAVKTPADYGATFLSDEMAAMLGLVEVGEDYQKPETADDAKQRNLRALQDEYNEDVQQLKNRIAAAMLESGTQATKVSAAQSEFATRKAQYAADRKIILNS